jgi:hypothetical protein
VESLAGVVDAQPLDGVAAATRRRGGEYARVAAQDLDTPGLRSH